MMSALLQRRATSLGILVLDYVTQVQSFIYMVKGVDHAVPVESAGKRKARRLRIRSAGLEGAE